MQLASLISRYIKLCFAAYAVTFAVSLIVFVGSFAVAGVEAADSVWSSKIFWLTTFIVSIFLIRNLIK